MSTEKSRFNRHQKSEKSVPAKKRSAKKIALTVVSVLLALVVIVCASGYGLFSYYYGKLNHQALRDNYDIASDIAPDDDVTDGEDSAKEDIEDLEGYLNGNLQDDDNMDFSNKNVQNILLIGTDNRKTTSKGSRSDSMIIISINRETKKIVMASVMRDIYVKIPGVGSNRINAAHAYGGVELLLDTIKANFKIPINKYVKVDFYSFMEVVDTIGGITMDVTAEEIGVMQGYIKELNKLEGVSSDTDMLYSSDAGRIHMNGKQTLAYSRVRYVGNGDFSRTERQRKVLTAVLNKAKGLSLGELNDLANVLLPKVTTNLSQGDMLSMLANSMSYLNYDVDSFSMPIKGSYKYLKIRGMSVLGIDLDANRKYWYNNVYK